MFCKTEKESSVFFSIVFQAQDWDLPHRPMTPSRKLDQQNGSSFMFNRSRAPGPAILNRSQPAFKRGYLVKKGDLGVLVDRLVRAVFN